MAPRARGRNRHDTRIGFSLSHPPCEDCVPVVAEHARRERLNRWRTLHTIRAYGGRRRDDTEDRHQDAGPGLRNRLWRTLRASVASSPPPPSHTVPRMRFRIPRSRCVAPRRFRRRNRAAPRSESADYSPASLMLHPLDWEDVELALASGNAGHLSYMPNRARPTALTASAGPLTTTRAAR